MKKIFLLLALFPVSASLNAQGFMCRSNSDFGRGVTIFEDNDRYPDLLLGREQVRIRYDCSYAFEDPGRNPIRAEYVLQVGATVSKFYQLIQHQVDSLLDAGGRKYRERYDLYGQANFLYVRDCFYVDRNTNKLIFTGRLVTEDFLYEEDLPQMDWTIGEQTREVCGFMCRQATTRFRGRDYVVWFAEAIPSSAGPWKLQGLPGVILEAEDIENKVHFLAVSVEQSKSDIRRKDYPYIKVTRKQYARMLEQYLSNTAVFTSQHVSRVAGMSVQATGKIDPLPVPVSLELD